MSDGTADPVGLPLTGSAVRTVEEESPAASGPAEPDATAATGLESESESTGAEAVPDDGDEQPSGADGPDTSGPPLMGDFRTALVSGVSVDLPNQHPTVVLRESESPRRQLSFSVSLQDGVVLSHALRRIATPRPLTHELLSEVLKGFEIDVVAVRLVGRRGAVYFAELDLRGPRGRSVHSCRPSDALAVALVQSVPVPILIDRRLFEEIGDVTPAGPAAAPA